MICIRGWKKCLCGGAIVAATFLEFPAEGNNGNSMEMAMLQDGGSSSVQQGGSATPMSSTGAVQEQGPVPSGEGLGVLTDSIDVIVSGMEVFRPHERELKHGKDYDEVKPLRIDTSRDNFKNLKDTLENKEFRYKIKERGIQVCRGIQMFGKRCRLAARSLSSLQCSMREIGRAIEAAIQAEPAILESDGIPKHYCSYVLSKILQYIDLMVFYTPFEFVERGKTPKEALEAAFIHWGFVPQLSPRNAQGEMESSMIELRNQVTSGGQRATLQAVRKPPSVEQIVAEDTLFKGLTEGLLLKNPKSMLSLAAFYNPALKAGLLLLLLAHLRFNELFEESSESETRAFPNLVNFLTSSVASQRSALDDLCQIKHKKIRSSPELPKELKFIPRNFFIRVQYNVGNIRVACDLLEDAISNMQTNYESALNYFNEIMSSAPLQVRRRTVLLQKNAAPSVNFRRLCFGLGKVPKSDVLEKDDPCSLEDLLSESDMSSGGGGSRAASFVQGAEEEIARTDVQDLPQLLIKREEKEYYFLNIQVAARIPKRLIEENLSALLTKFAVRRADSPLAKDPRSFKDVMDGIKKHNNFCDGLRGSDLDKHITNQGLQTALDFEQKCTASRSSQEWKSLQCQKFLPKLHCAYFRNTWSTINNFLQPSYALGWMARQEPCIGRHCDDWQKLHPYKIMTAQPEEYNKLDLFSPWIRTILTFQEWYSLYRMKKNDFEKKSAIFELSGFQAGLDAGGERDKKGILSKLLGMLKKKQKLTTSHVRFLMAQLSPEAMAALQSAFRPIVHPDTFHQLNQYAAFMSTETGRLQRPGGLAEKLDSIITSWTYAGMPPEAQDKINRGLSPSTKDFEGFNLTQPPPESKELNNSIKKEMLAALALLSQQPEVREQLWVACQRVSRSSTSIQLMYDSWHLLKEAGDDMLLVGIVVNPKNTSARLQKNILQKFMTVIRGVIDKLLRLPNYVLQHATYTAVVPSYPKIALVVRALSQVYIKNPSVFKDTDVFRKAIEAMLDILQNTFFSPAGLPPAVPLTALLKNINPFYATMGAENRAAEFRRSVMSTFFAHLWKLVLNLSLDHVVRPKDIEKKERQYSQPSWQKSMMDPLQANSFRMVLTGGDIGLTIFDNMLSRDQKKMLKSVRFGTGMMFTYNTLLAGKVYTELGYRSYGNFIATQSPFLGKMVVQWIEKRKNDRIREIFGWIGLALFFVSAVVSIVGELNAVAMAQNSNAAGSVDLSSAASDSVANQSALASSSSCGPMGVCLDPPTTGLEDSAGELIDSPPMSASPVLTAIFIVLKVVVMASLASVLGPGISIYMIVSSHWKFLERIEMAVVNLFKWFVYKIKHSRFGQWFKNLKESRKAKQEAKRLAKLAGKQKKQTGDDSLSDLESEVTYHAENLQWSTLFGTDSPNQPTSEPKPKPPKTGLGRFLKKK